MFNGWMMDKWMSKWSTLKPQKQTCYIFSNSIIKLGFSQQMEMPFLSVYKFKINILDELNTTAKILNTVHLSSFILHLLTLPVSACAGPFLLAMPSPSLGHLYVLVPWEEISSFFFLTMLNLAYPQISHPVFTFLGKTFQPSLVQVTKEWQ